MEMIPVFSIPNRLDSRRLTFWSFNDDPNFQRIHAVIKWHFVRNGRPGTWFNVVDPNRNSLQFTSNWLWPALVESLM